MPGDVRRKYTPDGTVVEVRNFSNKCNGMTYDADLNLLVCEHVDELARPREPGRFARDHRARSSRARSSTARTTSASTRPARSTSPTRGTGACPASGIRASGGSASRASTASRRAAATLELIVGRGRVRDAERPLLLARTRRSSTSTTRPGRTSRSTTSTRTGRSRTAACSSRASAPACIEEGIPRRDEVRRAREHLGHRAGRRLGHLPAGEHLGTILVPENTGNMTWGGDGLAHALHPELHVALLDPNDRRPAREPYMRLGGDR